MFWLEVMPNMQNAKREEITLNLRVRPAVHGHGWSALLESDEPGTQIRFQDLQTLMRYLQALSDCRPVKGLR
jgi:hypothetical protein